ncbi:MAG TPA: sigma-70 family RNA polymerase sigma factor, partial [Terriglobales bacterium]|nr:sigma-70 family RNA polymerase sigma factor [Terriglobales bacterium]
AETEKREVWSDERLVRECLAGNEEAWSALIDKYKKLIYSIPIKWNLPREDANDIFQSVCVDLYADLARLREPRALPKWLIQATLHKCARLRQQESRFVDEDISDDLAPLGSGADALIEEVQQEQIVRDAIASLTTRCAEMINMLFFESPARPYSEIAKELGLATGSIGFIRGRCLERLKKALVSRGWK